jgi:hypothetical protein
MRQMRAGQVKFLEENQECNLNKLKVKSEKLKAKKYGT